MHRRDLIEREKVVKKNLLGQVKESSIPLEEIVDWLWEDFGKRVRPTWDRVEKAILGDPDITPQDLAVFMIDQGLMPEEGAWDALPRRGLRSGKTGP